MSRDAPIAEVAFTFDLHDVDLPEDIVRAAEWFREQGRAATFFVPSAMLQETRYAEALRALPRLGHEVGSHGHLHDWREMDALMWGAAAELRFLAESRDRFAQFFGVPPTSFRSPRWCTLGRAATSELVRLGYEADSSATPQRFPLFSARPFHPGWWSTPRRVHALAPGLIEVPTSTLLLPAGAPTFLTLRSVGTRVFLALIELEARLHRGRPIVLQFHVEDFSPESRRDRAWGRPTWKDLQLRPRGGFRFKVFLRDTDAERIVSAHSAIVSRYRRYRATTITDIARAFRSAWAGRGASGAEQTIYEAAGGHDGILSLAHAWHRRVLEDEVVSHAFSHGFHPQHTERLAAYWAEALGGPTTYSDRHGNETSVVRMHSGNGPHEEMDRRAIACFDQALEDVGFDERVRRALHDYFAWATTTSMARYHRAAKDVPEGMQIPRWSWDGLVEMSAIDT